METQLIFRTIFLLATGVFITDCSLGGANEDSRLHIDNAPSSSNKDKDKDGEQTGKQVTGATDSTEGNPENGTGDGNSGTVASTDSGQTGEKPNNPPKITSTPVATVKVGNGLGEPTVFNLNKWTKVQYDFHDEGPANWVVSGNTATQISASNDASMLLSDVDVKNERVEGQIIMGEPHDDDFIGFVFGVQSRTAFYLFDWKQVGKSWRGYNAEQGMAVKLINSKTEYTNGELWATASSSDGKLTNLFHNDIAWSPKTTYTITLDFVPGATKILVKKGEDLLAPIALSDATFSSGKFGFYSYSQDNVTFAGFKKTLLVGDDYVYQVQAQDPEGDPLVYSLLKAPEGMTIDSAKGLISWKKDDVIPGTFPVTIKVTDKHDQSVEQNFELVAK